MAIEALKKYKADQAVALAATPISHHPDFESCSYGPVQNNPTHIKATCFNTKSSAAYVGQVNVNCKFVGMSDDNYNKVVCKTKS